MASVMHLVMDDITIDSGIYAFPDRIGNYTPVGMTATNYHEDGDFKAEPSGDTKRITIDRAQLHFGDQLFISSDVALVPSPGGVRTYEYIVLPTSDPSALFSFATGEYGITEAQQFLYLPIDGASSELYMQGGDGVLHESFFDGSVLQDNEFHYVTVIIDLRGEESTGFKLYDGVDLVADLDVPMLPSLFTFWDQVGSNNDALPTVSPISQSNNSQQLMEFMIHNRALSLTEIAQRTKNFRLSRLING